MSLSEGAVLLCTLFLALSLAALCMAGMLFQMARQRTGWRVTAVTVLGPEEDDDER